jgi:hypothetical protein
MCYDALYMHHNFNVMMPSIMFPTGSTCCNLELVLFAITSVVRSATRRGTNPAFICLAQVLSSPTNYAHGLSKVCTALTSVTNQTNQVCTQTVSTIKSVTSSVMNSVMSSAIAHPVQVVRLTTNSTLGLYKVCA